MKAIGRPRKSVKKRRITSEDLLRFHWVSEPQVSPDGSRVVFVKKHVGDKNQYVRDLWMVAADGDGTPSRFTAGERDAHPRWSPDGEWIGFIAARDKVKPQVYRIAAAGGEATAITSFPEGSIGDFAWSPDGRQIAVSFRERAEKWTAKAQKDRDEKGLSTPPREVDDWWYRLDGDGYFDADRYRLYLVDLVTGAHRKVFDKDATGLFSFDWSPDGRELAIAANLDRRGLVHPWKASIYRLDARTLKLTALPGLPDGPKEAVKWSPDGSLIAWAGRLGESDSYDTQNLELFVSDAKKGGAKSLTGREDYCLLAASISDSSEAVFAPSYRWSPDSRRLYMRLGWHGETHVASVKRGGGSITFHTSGAREHDPHGLSRDGRKMAMVVGDATTIGEIHIGEVQGDGELALRRLTSFNQALLAELELSRPRGHWVTSSGGAKVQVWSMAPVGGKRAKAPAILEIHGGPHAQYGLGFFHEFQLLAAQGYHVFFPNPRGSKGYGAKHCAAIRGAWGSADWDDVSAVTEFMRSRPEVDASRIGIMGGSYGGYMTNWAIGHSQLYRAAITDRCVSNLVSMFGNSDFPSLPDHYWPGNAWDRPEKLWAQSPLAYFGKVKTPTLIIHSEGDLRCNVEQSEQVFHALKIRNIPTRFVRYPSSTSHGMSRGGPPDLRIHRLGEICAWWRRWLAR